MLKSSNNILSSLHDYSVENLLFCTKDSNEVAKVAWIRKNYPHHFHLLSEQLKLYNKALAKLPGWVKKNCLFTAQSLEQCSSPATAHYKASLFKGELMVDLTAGIGVDAVAFAEKFKQVIAIDKDENVHALAEFNLSQLAITNVQRVNTDADSWLHKQRHADLYYIDADRRPITGKKVITLEDSTPNVLALLPIIKGLTKDVLLKCSPLIDITYLFSRIDLIQQITVLSVEQEVKEILVHLVSKPDNPFIKAVNLSAGGEITHEFEAQVSNLSAERKLEEDAIYFYETGNVLIKSGLSDLYANQIGLSQLGSKTPYYTGNKCITSFFGRAFKIITCMPMSKSNVLAYLKNNTITKANIAAKGFGVSVDDLRSTFKLKDGGEEYLFFVKHNHNEKVFYHVRKF